MTANGALRPPRKRTNRYWVLMALLIAALTAVSLFNYHGVSVSPSSAQISVASATRGRSSSTSQLAIELEKQKNESKVVQALVDLLRRKQDSTLAAEKIYPRLSSASAASNAPPLAAPTPSDEPTRNIFQGDEDASELHIVFSMSCSQGRRLSLQTILQYSAAAVGQRGPITQILSGCSDAERAAVMTEPTLYYDFRRHFTPAYSPHPEPNITDNYTPYNKPFALRHFLRHAYPAVQQDIIALIDADFVLFKRIEVNTGRDVTKYYKGARDLASVNETVTDGLAIAQDWSTYLQAGWYEGRHREKLEAVCAGKPCMNVSEDDAREFYSSTGPPYIMTRSDMERMVDDYCALVVRGRQMDQGWMVEMYAYALAVANNDIKHTLLTNLGPTHPKFAGNDREYWTFVDEALPNPCADPSAVVMPEDPPVGIHYCQKYGFVEGPGKGHYYYKYDLPETLTDCDSPLLKVPPASDWDTLLNTTEEDKLVGKRHEVWVECSATKIVNQAMIKYKQRACPVGYNTEQSVEMVKTRR